MPINQSTNEKICLGVTNSQKMQLCTHCDEEILIPYYAKNNKAFCCNGCLTVYELLQNKGLDEYYQIKNVSEIYKRRAPVQIKEQKFLYLDSPDFLAEYTYKNKFNEITCEFYLEGIHCLACLWLIEKMPDFLPFVTVSHLDINKSIVTISVKDGGELSKVARELNNLGHPPHPLKRSEDYQRHKIKEDQKMLLKIGIAGAGAANIMLYAFSNYAGADGNYQKVFNLLTVFFAFPVFLYSATPFYKNAWSALKYKRLSIDVPISLSLIVGFFVGIYYQIIGINENFFDSLTALVFLLLLSRYFLNKIQAEGLKSSDLSFFYQTSSVLKKENDIWIEIHPQYLKVGDVFKVLNNDVIPVDGVIQSGQTKINNALLTGESAPVSVTAGSKVYSGTINLEDEIMVKVLEVKEQTRLGKILKQVQNARSHQSPIVDFTDKIAKYFILIVLSMAGITFFKYAALGDYKQALDKCLTLLIVTCPCALALATPLTLTRTLARAAKKGIIIKNDDVIEKLSKIKNIFLDKTGTLTFGQLKIIKFFIHKLPCVDLKQVIISLEKKSKHPVATALCEYAYQNQKRLPLEVNDFAESIGLGVKGIIANKTYKITKGKIFEDGILIAEYQVNDKLRPEVTSAFKKLKEIGLSLSLISGDQESEVKKIIQPISTYFKNIWSDLSPEEKLVLVNNNPDVMMVGDGANDAMALSRSAVGVAVQGSMDISLRAAKVYLTTPGIKQISDLIILSKETMKVIYRNLFLSLVYNGVSVYLAFTGQISPLNAAIIMPLSSLTVLLSTLLGTPQLNKILSNKDLAWKS